MNNKLEKTLEIANLFRVYQNLLTVKQKQYLALYTDEDWSLQEIADNFKISKNAVHDAIQKAITNLKKFEQKLNLCEKEIKIQKILHESSINETKKIQKMLKVWGMEV